MYPVGWTCPGPSCPLHMGWSSEKQQQSPAQRTWGSADLGTNPLTSILSPENFPGCFLFDTLVKPALSIVLEADASQEGSRYSQLCISTL